MEQQSTETTKLPWSPLWAVVYAVIIYFAASFIGGLLLWGGATLWPLGDGNVSDWLTSSTTAQFIYVVLVEILSLLAVAYFLKTYKQRWSVLGLKKPRLKDGAVAVMAYPVYFIAFAAVLIAATQLLPGLDVEQEQQLGFDNVQGTLALVMTFVSLVILPPLVEEIIVRGLIFTSLRQHFKFWGAALVTSLVFALAHLPAGGDSGPLYVAAIDTFILSVVLCFLREKTGSLWAGIALHAIKNSIAFVSLFILAAH